MTEPTNDVPFAARPTDRRALPPGHFPLWLCYLVFVVYGSLVPLDFHPLPLEQAWAAFLQIPMLHIGLGGRADWVANGILYIPLGFLTHVLFADRGRSPRGPAAAVAAASFCFALAVGVEFTQLYFPQRTVSLNDVLAEGVGSVAGVLMAGYGRRWYLELLATFGNSGDRLLTRFLQAYGIGYLVLCFFPFDFVLSAAELATKLGSAGWGWLIAPLGVNRGPLVAVAKLLAEIAAVMPLGLLLGRWNGGRNVAVTRHALVVGAMLGLVIEGGQLLVFSGISQGLSVLTRMLGVYAGTLVWRERKRLVEMPASRSGPGIPDLAIALYAIALLAFNGWFDHPWHGMAQAAGSLADTRFLPFYYHYFTTEQAALVSLMTVVMTYAPLAALIWIRSRSPSAAGWLTAICAAVVEGGKLFLDGLHPDPSNVLIAAVSGWGIAMLMERVFPDPRPHSRSRARTPAAEPATPVVRPRVAAPQRTLPGTLAWILPAIGLAGYWLADFPVQPLPLALLLAAAALAVWLKPVSALALVPAALPVLDLAPWSGRFFLDEFDALLLVVLATGFARVDPAGSSLFACRRTRPWLAMLLASYAVSTLIALIPLPSIDANSFTSYFSPFNALRIAKGLVWALLFASLYGRLAAIGTDVFTWFSWGIAVGLALTDLILLREKALFGGLLNFNSDYRATGPFSAIHVGGAFIECYLSVAVPFLIFLIVRTRHWLLRILGMAVLLATTYALMATVARNGFVAFGVALIATAFSLLVTRTGLRRHGMVVVLLLAASIAVAYPIFGSRFTQSRLAQVGQDLDVRTAHWREALDLREDGWITQMFGMGLGRYPAARYWSNQRGTRSSLHGLAAGDQGSFLRIAPGNTIYVEQIIDLQPHQRYRLNFDFRPTAPGAVAGIAICEKWMLVSARCAAWKETPSGLERDKWHPVSFEIASGELGDSGWLKRRPVKLSLLAIGRGTFDLDNIALIDGAGKDAVDNGHFDENLDHWFFSTDEHLEWHTKSLPIAVLFDQGWFGLLSLAVLVAIVLVSSAGPVLRGNTESGIVTAALLSFLVVGIFDTLIDSPRFLFILMVLLLISIGASRRPAPNEPQTDVDS